MNDDVNTRVAAPLGHADDRRHLLPRDLFVAVAHELAGPLSTIAMAADNLASAFGKDHPMVDIIIAEAARVRGTLADLLDTGRIAGDGVAACIEECAVRRIIDGALALAAEATTTRGLVDVMIAESTPTVLCDLRFAERALANLVTNAIRHGAAPVCIDSERSGERVDILVRDAGPGLGGDAADRLFEEFRPHGPTGQLGLGLSVARSLVRSFGGDVVLRSSRPACFALELPLSRRSSP